MYDLIVTLHFSYLKVQSREDHHGLKNAIKETQTDFQNVLFFSQRNKILLTDEILTQSKIVFTKVKDWNAVATIELNEMNYLEERDLTTDTERIYRSAEHEITEVQRVISNLKSNPEVMTIEADIKNLRKLIEKYFSQLVG